MFFPKNISTLVIFFLSCCLLFTFSLSASYLRNNEIFFNTDIARDFLLLDDVISTHKLPLIGPRSGAISGLFHGPLWIYLNTPIFILGNGNPVTIGWFWFLLALVGTISIFFIGKKLGNTIVGLYSAVLFSAYLAPAIPSFF
jgi:hypothetical protein